MGLASSLLARSLPLMPRSLVGWVARRYVAGEDLAAVERTVGELNRQGAVATVSLLGEEVEQRDEAEAAVEECLEALDLIAHQGLEANLSVKLTLLGLRIDEELCRRNLERVAVAARELDIFVRIDMEDHTCTDATLRLYHGLQAELGNLGVVLQAYLRRTLADIAGLPGSGANVRLCKGIYVEPPEVAWQDYETVRVNFLQALEKLLRRGAYVGIATHDEYLVCAAAGIIDRLGIAADRYEYQMLLGVTPALRQVLVTQGHRVRVYVPYGRDWYPYSVRRLRENPQIAVYVLRALLGRR